MPEARYTTLAEMFEGMHAHHAKFYESKVIPAESSYVPGSYAHGIVFLHENLPGYVEAVVGNKNAADAVKVLLKGMRENGLREAAPVPENAKAEARKALAKLGTSKAEILQKTTTAISKLRTDYIPRTEHNGTSDMYANTIALLENMLFIFGT